MTDQPTVDVSPQVGTTPDGILMGADAPVAPPVTVTPTETNASANTVLPPAYSEDDINRARQQEKSKLYSRLDKMQEEVEALRRERDERQRLESEQAKAEEEARTKAAEEEMNVRELLAKRETEWNEQLETLKREQERDRALLEQERQYSEITAYTARRIEEERENILPELVDLVTGSTREEIEASIESLKARSNAIFDSAQQAMSAARRDTVGARVTLPSPVENPSENSSFTPEDIRAMSLQEYAKHRQRLLSQEAQGRSQGLFG